jgi:hypothetical protein
LSGRDNRVVVNPRAWAMLSTVTLVTGALLVGDALHGSVVTGAYGIASPASVFRPLPGLVLIAIGARVRPDPEEFAPVSTGSTEGGEEDDDAFEPELSPVGETIDGAERDDE